MESTGGTVAVEAKGAKALEPETTSAHEPDPAAARDLSEVGASFNRELVLTPGVKTTMATEVPGSSKKIETLKALW